MPSSRTGQPGGDETPPPGRLALPGVAGAPANPTDNQVKPVVRSNASRMPAVTLIAPAAEHEGHPDRSTIHLLPSHPPPWRASTAVPRDR